MINGVKRLLEVNETGKECFLSFFIELDQGVNDENRIGCSVVLSKAKLGDIQNIVSFCPPLQSAIDNSREQLSHHVQKGDSSVIARVRPDSVLEIWFDHSHSPSIRVGS